MRGSNLIMPRHVDCINPALFPHCWQKLSECLTLVLLLMFCRSFAAKCHFSVGEQMPMPSICVVKICKGLVLIADTSNQRRQKNINPLRRMPGKRERIFFSECGESCNLQNNFKSQKLCWYTCSVRKNSPEIVNQLH